MVLPKHIEIGRDFSYKIKCSMLAILIEEKTGIKRGIEGIVLIKDKRMDRVTIGFSSNDKGKRTGDHFKVVTGLKSVEPCIPQRAFIVNESERLVIDINYIDEKLYPEVHRMALRMERISLITYEPLDPNVYGYKNILKIVRKIHDLFGVIAIPDEKCWDKKNICFHYYTSQSAWGMQKIMSNLGIPCHTGGGRTVIVNGEFKKNTKLDLFLDSTTNIKIFGALNPNQMINLSNWKEKIEFTKWFLGKKNVYTENTNGEYGEFFKLKSPAKNTRLIHLLSVLQKFGLQFRIIDKNYFVLVPDNNQTIEILEQNQNVPVQRVYTVISILTPPIRENEVFN